MRSGMSVDDLAKYATVSANTVRYYARQRLLLPRRNPENGYRVFSDADLARLRFIRRAKDFGLTLGEIRAILTTVDGGASPCALVRTMVRGRITETEERLAQLAELRGRLERALAAWTELPDCAPDLTAICSVFDASDAALAYAAARGGDGTESAETAVLVSMSED